MNQGHSLSEFDCSNATLNTWLNRYAWTNQRAETARTYVAHRGGRVLGYHALAAGSVQKHQAPERIVQGIANHPVGVILLARLPVDKTEQGQGLGKALLRDAARKFYMHHGFQPSPVDPMLLMMLMKDLRASL